MIEYERKYGDHPIHNVRRGDKRTIMMKPNCKLSSFLILLVVVVSSPSCAIRRAAYESEQERTSLNIEEYALESLTCEADPEARCFVPVSGAFEEIMAKRAFERGLPPEPMPIRDDGELSVTLLEKQLKARITDPTGKNGEALFVSVSYAGEEIFKRPLGPPSPVDALQGLWAHDGHWYLEMAENPSGSEYQESSGSIVRDGEAFNDQLGYEETFGFTILSGEPFYFFRQNGVIDISFGGEIIPVGYEHIPHYGCCSAARLNPVRAENMISFFAQREGRWYYVETGVYP